MMDIVCHWAIVAVECFRVLNGLPLKLCNQGKTAEHSETSSSTFSDKKDLFDYRRLGIIVTFIFFLKEKS